MKDAANLKDEWKNEAPGLPPVVPHELLGWEGVPGEIK